jgi:hypothetical protein
MKNAHGLLTLACSLAFACNSFATIDLSGNCKKIEFSELKTYSKKELQNLYCYNEKLEKVHSNSSSKYSELGAPDKAAIANEKGSACSSENERIVRILKSTPKC